MTQSDFGTINPTTKSGTQLAADLNAFRDAVNTKHSGAARPSYVQAGMEWLDTSAAPIWTVKLYDGSEDVILYQIDTTNNIAKPTQTRQEVIKTADYTLTPDDAYVAIIMNKASASVVALPALSGTNSELYFVKNIAANSVTIDPNSTETIEGASTATLATGESAWIWPASGKGSWRIAVIKNNVATLTGTETLTNKTLTSPTINTPSGEFLRGYINGLTLSNNTTDATNDIDIAAGSAASDGTTPVLMTLASVLTKRLDAAWAVGSGNGGLDTGSKANSTGYFVWLISRSDTGVVDAIYSTSSTSPTMPTNYDRKRLIGWVVTDSSGVIRQFIQTDDYFEFSSKSVDYSASIGTTALTTTALPVPTGAKRRVFYRSYQSNTAASYVLIADPDTPDVAPSGGAGGLATSLNWSNQIEVNETSVMTNASGQLRVRSNQASTTLSLAVVGFIFKR